VNRAWRRQLAEVALAFALVGAGVWATTRLVVAPWVVAGRSMEPTLAPGDRVLVDLWSYRRRPPRPGELVLFAGPGGAPMVKRVASGPPRGAPRQGVIPAKPGEVRIWVLGDNGDASLDSRAFGPVPMRRVRGRVAWRYWPLPRAGRIR
jgi:signal peptidase I